MSLITRLRQIGNQSASHRLTEDVQPMLLKEDEMPSWVFNSSAWCLIILFIAASMIVFGLMIADKKSPAAVLPTKTASLTMPQPIAIPKSIEQPVNTLSIKNANMASGSQDANQYYQSAVDSLKKGHITSAITNLNQAIIINPQFEKAREALAVLFIQNDNVSSALSILNQGLDLSPDYSPFVKLKAQILINEGLYDDALHLLTENLPEIEQHPGYYALLAAVYNKEKKYLIAADIYRQLTQLNPNAGQWWFGLGASLNLAGKNNEAKTAYQKALQVGGIKPDVRAYLETQLGA